MGPPEVIREEVSAVIATPAELGGANSQGVEVRPFKAGSIHDKEYFEFWTSTLGISNKMADTIKNGYQIPWRELPKPFEAPNNKTVKDNLAICQEIVTEMAELGVIEFVDSKPLCINPLGLVTRMVAGKVKHRLVFDGSRWINLHVDPPQVKLAHLEKVLECLETQDFMATFDLKSAYYQVKMSQASIPYLGAALDFPAGKRYFVYKCLPFGLNSAVHIFTKLWKPLLSYLHKKGIKFSIYIDDGIVMAPSLDQLKYALSLVYQTITQAGWQLALDKSDTPGQGSTVKQYLGFILDSNAGKVQCPQQRLLSIVKQMEDAVQLDSIPLKELASITGKLASLVLSHGPLARICTRSAYCAINQHVETQGWKGSTPLVAAVKKEWKFFAGRAEQDNGFPIVCWMEGVRLSAALEGVVLQKDQIVKSSTLPSCWAFSDASAFKAAVKFYDNNTSVEFSFLLSREERQQSSGMRELLAIHKMMKHADKVALLKSKNVIWCTDSTNVVAFWNKGSSIPAIQNALFDLVKMVKDMDCELQILHIRREDPRLAEVDTLSKTKDSDNWSIDFASFQALNNEFQYEVDLFADNINARLPKFVSKFYHEKALETDAFTINWNIGSLWVCPPVGEAGRTILKIRREKCKGTLIVPDWPATHYYTLIFSGGKLVPPFKSVQPLKAYICQNENATKTPLFGFTDFAMLAVYFDNM